ncbi:response regulator [Paenibacillus sp. GCM10023248]|uniref:response regulator transcription factor n=1 Tax=Bacillales TaxID=1385 RepID=UPI0023785E44|nr:MULTISPECIES: response regulator [Bacillales]MDD9271414.1 response regulator [Paenibacillus sp. MAHUQ-63]MDR6884371.1 two-component system response regulator YesN [Bacillus sp. 3255]
MFRILIVDDEHIEREGIKRLIHKYKLPLNVLEAENGEEALDILASRPIDILFTDIKMPFMDGLELCRRARELYPDLHMMIFSAYGEFEYAQKAIHYHIFSYLLKPVDVSDFIREFNRVIELCEKDQEQEKEQLLLELIQSSYRQESWLTEKLALSGIDMRHTAVQMLLVDFTQPVFDAEHDELPAQVKAAIATPFHYVNLNEHQSLFFFLHDRGLCKEQLEPVGLKLKECLHTHRGGMFTLVAGRLTEAEGDLAQEFKVMENVLEYKFFYQESTVLYTDESQGKEDLTDVIPKLMETVYWHLEMKDLFGFRKGVELFFKTIDGSGQHSAIYIKYMCIELAKKIWEKAEKHDHPAFKSVVETIFGSKSLTALKEQVHAVMALLGSDQEGHGPEHGKKVIKDIVKLIEDNYMSDISLKWIADRVFLTQTYLSYLFHKEVGQTIVKYITLVRMQKAEELLRSTNLTVADISQQVGFMNTSYFCKTFKHYRGCSPAKFREMTG